MLLAGDNLILGLVAYAGIMYWLGLQTLVKFGMGFLVGTWLFEVGWIPLLILAGWLTVVGVPWSMPLGLLYGATFPGHASKTGTRAIAAFRRWQGWRCYQQCYRHRVIVADSVRTEAQTRPCIYACGPHGVNAVSFLMTFMIQRGGHVDRRHA